MSNFALLFIGCLLGIDFSSAEKQQYEEATSILHPLNQLQVLLRISDCSPESKAAAPVSQSVDHFILHDVPFQLYCGPNHKYKRPHYTVARTVVVNRLAWIVFQTVPHPFARISLYHLLMGCCIVWGGKHSEPIRKDLFILIADITRAPNWPIRDGYECNIARCSVPFFLIAFRWRSNPNGVSVTPPAVWAVESCYFLETYTITLDDYFTNVANKGITRFLVEDIQRADFFLLSLFACQVIQWSYTVF